MKKIVFPNLNLEFNINNIAFEIGNIKMYWYGIIIVFAIIVALVLMKKDNGKYGIKFDDILNICLITIPVSFIFARIYYVIFKINYYIQYPQKILNFRDGGIAIYGGIIGGIITIYIYSKIKKLDFIKILDYIAPYLALAQSIGRWGNFINIEAYGYETNSLLKMGIWESGIYKEVHPTFLYESIGDFVIFIILFINRKNISYKGQIVYNYLILYAILRIVTESIRVDSLKIGNFRISIIVSIIFLIIGLLNRKKNERTRNSKKTSCGNENDAFFPRPQKHHF